MSPYSRTVALTALEFFPLCLILCGFGREMALIETHPGKKQTSVKPVWFCHTASSQATATQAARDFTNFWRKMQAGILVCYQNQLNPHHFVCPMGMCTKQKLCFNLSFISIYLAFSETQVK